MEINKIYNEDCILGLSKLPDNSVDLIITSPPYNNFHNKRTQKNRASYWERTNIVYDTYDDKMTDKEYMDWQINVINECIRVLKPTGTLAYNHKDRILNYEVLSPLQWIFSTNAIFRQRVTWDRCGMQAYNPVRFFRVEEDIYLLGKQAKGFKWNKDCSKYLSIWKIPPTKNTNHPCSFPDEIPKRLIEAFSEKGDLVLDPFMGSGTTAKVALEMGRNFIGFEISNKYCEMANEMIKSESNALKLF